MKHPRIFIFSLIISCSLGSILKNENPSLNYLSNEKTSFIKLFQEWELLEPSQVHLTFIDKSGKKHSKIPKNNKLKRPEVSYKNSESSINPGAVLSISFELVDYVKNQIVALLYEQFKDFNMPTEVEIPGLKMWNMNVKLENLNSENVHIFLNPEDNSMVLDFNNLSMSLNSDITIEKYYISKSGKVKVNSIIDKFIMKVYFQDDGQTLKLPKIQFELVELVIPPSKLDIDLNLDYIPTIVTDFILSFINGMLLDQIEIFLSQFLPTDGTNQVNNLIIQNYPQEISLFDDKLMLSMFLTENILVEADGKSNRLRVALDGMSFLKSEGRLVREIPSEILFTEEDTEGVVLGFSQELVGSALKILFNKIFQNKFEFANGVVKTDVSENTFKIKTSGMTLENVSVNADVSLAHYTIQSNFILNSGLEVNKFDFQKDTVTFSITKVLLSDYSFKSNNDFVQSFGPYIKSLAEAFGLFFHNFTFPIPGFELPYNIHLDTAQFRNQKGFTVLKVDSHKEQ